MSKVIVLGGGVAGMSAAHELVERGYEVEVYDSNPKYVGGKARSIDYYGNPEDPYKIPLPGEHGFRFFPGFYKHVTDTMKRIPFTTDKGKKQSVYDNLTPTERIMIAQYNKEPIITDASFPKSLSDLKVIIKDVFGTDVGLTKEEEKFFAERTWQLMTSSTTRKMNDYEKLGWWQYLQADRFSDQYRSLLVAGLTRTLVAARAETASTKTGGDIFLQLLYSMFDPAVKTDRVLNGPTNDKWLNPWLEYLESKHVKYFHGHQCVHIALNKTGQVDYAVVRDGEQNEHQVKGDHYILAVPVERAAELITPEMKKVDKTLGFIQQLAPSVSWMNGLQYFLTEDVKINDGHVIYSDSEWAVTSISQVQFWEGYDITTKGDGRVKGVLSVDISDWFSAGLKNSKCADDCTRKQISDEVWEQLKTSLNINGKEVLRDDMRVDWYLDGDISENTSIKDIKANLESDREPLLVNNVNTWGLRPIANSYIHNLYLAADYVRTYTDLATMEGANEAARRAVNCILDADNSAAPKCKIWPLHNPALVKPLMRYDKKRWQKGLPWTDKLPVWLKLFMVFWVGSCLVIGLLKMILKKITK